MEITLIKKEKQENFEGKIQIEIGIGKVETKLKNGDNNSINIGGAEVEPVKQLFKEKLMSMVDDKDIENFENSLEQYKQFAIYNFIGLTSVPLTAVVNNDGTIAEVEGLDENKDWGITIKNKGE